MTLDHARRLLDHINLLWKPCDLDLLVFFARHPRVLLASEQVAILLGYEVTQIASSLDRLERSGLLVVSEDPAYLARKYVFAAGGQNTVWLPELLQIASTRDGRLVLMRALRERSAGTTGSPATRSKRVAGSRPASNKRRKGKIR